MLPTRVAAKLSLKDAAAAPVGLLSALRFCAFGVAEGSPAGAAFEVEMNVGLGAVLALSVPPGRSTPLVEEVYPGGHMG